MPGIMVVLDFLIVQGLRTQAGPSMRAQPPTRRDTASGTTRQKLIFSHDRLGSTIFRQLLTNVDVASVSSAENIPACPLRRTALPPN